MSDELDTTETKEQDTYHEGESGGVPVLQQLFLVGGILLLIFSATITRYFFTDANNTQETVQQENTPFSNTDNLGTKNGSIIKPFEEVEITGASAYVWDVQNQRALYKKNEEEIRPLASVTKLMTALVAYEILSANTKVSIPEKALSQNGDSGLLRDETFNRQSLTDLVLMSSSNDGAYALAIAAGNVLDTSKGELAFIQAMNVRANELGLYGTEFKNPTGLDLSRTLPGAVGSAKDMTFLMEYIVKNTPEILTFTQEESARIYSENGEFHDTSNTNYYINEIPGLIGSKTGYTDLAGGNLVIAYNAGLDRPIIIAVLGSTQVQRFTDVLKLIEETNSYLNNN